MSDIPNGEELKEKLFAKKKNGWEKTNPQERERIFKFAEEYIYFLNHAKTEREAAKLSKEMLEKNGFQNIEQVESLKEGDKVYYCNRSKTIYAAVIGKEALNKG